MVLLLTAPAALAAPHVAIAPAAGPAGTQVAVSGGGYPRRAVVVIAAGSAPRVRVRADGHGSFRGHLAMGSAARGRVAIVSRGRGARVVNRFRVQPSAGATGEAASSRGARVRWSADSGLLRLAGAGFGARVAVKVRASGATRTLRAGRRGRFAVSLPASPAGRALVTSRRTRLRFAFAALGQPRLPIRATFYYPWFPEAWRQGGIDPFTHFTPAAGFYSEDDAAVIRRQVEEMRYGRIDAGIASWWGQGTRSDRRIPALLAAAHATPFHWALYHEGEGHGDPDPAAIRADLEYIRDHYASDPAYLRVHGRFVVFVYADANDGAAMADRWATANDVGAYVVLKVFSGFRQAASQPAAWHQYAPARAEDDQPGQSFAVSPGFWHAAESAPRLERSVDRFAASVRAMVASGAPWQLVTTFNEWGEGTAVEPANEWSTASGYGAYLDVLHRNGR